MKHLFYGLKIKNHQKGILFLFLLFALVPFQQLFCQTALIYYSETPYKYFAAQDEIAADWFLPEFDDGVWLVDTGKIGFGNHAFDVVVPPETKSLYLRYQFDLSNPEAVEALSFMGDFDDGYIAYLNGKEILRKNVPDTLSSIPFNTLATRSHSPRTGTRAAVYGYYLDSTLLDTVLTSGTNTLAIQVINDSVSGSDLYFKLNLYNVTSGMYNIQRSMYRYKRKMKLDSTHLPLVIIESGERGIPVKRIEVPAYMGIISNTEEEYNKPDDPFNVFDGRVNIEVRGESSAGFPKRSYEFEFKDSAWNDSSIALLGMPKESDWILQGPWADKSQFRNSMIFELGRKTGHWAPRTVFCEVILNGDYIGLYTITEEIKRDGDRVDVAKLRREEISDLNLTGGYIMKRDKPNGAISIVYPNSNNLQAEQEEYILNFIQEYETNLLSKDGLDPLTGYRKYIDESSLIDLVIISELGKNCDSYVYSSYLHKNRDDIDDRIIFGPLWDFDLCFGNSVWQEGYRYDAWQWDFPLNSKFEIKRLFEDPYLVDQLENRWMELRNSFLHTDSLMAMINAYTSDLQDAIQRNYQVWPVISDDVFFEAYSVNSYDEEIDYMKNWIHLRLDWIDDNIEEVFYPITDYNEVYSPICQGIKSVIAYPNPYTDNLFIDVSLSQLDNLRLELLSAQGVILSSLLLDNMSEGMHTLKFEETHRVPPGVYLIDVYENDVLSQRLRVMKVE